MEKIVVTGRHLEVTESLKEYALEKAEKFNRYFNGACHIHIILSVEKHRHYAEANITINGTVINSKEFTEDMYASIDLVLEKAEQQLKKYKNKITQKRRTVNKHDADNINDNTQDSIL